jgi:hypothetical protein
MAAAAELVRPLPRWALIRARRDDSPVMSLRTKVLIGIALVRGFWGVSQDCHEWVDGRGYRLVHNDWWAKNRGCVARTPTGDELTHSEEFRSKAIGWGWQFAIFAVGSLPAITIVTVSALWWRRRSPGGDL